MGGWWAAAVGRSPAVDRIIKDPWDPEQATVTQEIHF